MRRAALPLLTALLALPTVPPRAVQAQQWRTLEASRPATADSAPLDVRLRYGAGRLTVRPASGPLLYRTVLRYDASRAEPAYRYEEVGRRLRVGIDRYEGGWSGRNDAEGGTLLLELGAATPIALEAELGALDGAIDLGGLRLRELSLKAGAADLEVTFDAPSPVTLRDTRIEAGAASLRVRRLGNARPQRIRASVGVGSLDLDLTGPWTEPIELTAEVALGGFTLRIPADAGIEVDASTFLSGFEKAGLQKRGGYFYSDNWDAATRRIRLRLSAALGKFELVREASRGR